MAMRVSGVSGAIYYGYHVVARLSAWKLEDSVLHAAASEVSTFDLESGGPFTLRLDMGKRQWEWKDAQVDQVEGEAVVRVTGSPTVRG